MYFVMTWLCICYDIAFSPESKLPGGQGPCELFSPLSPRHPTQSRCSEGICSVWRLFQCLSDSACDEIQRLYQSPAYRHTLVFMISNSAFKLANLILLPILHGLTLTWERWVPPSDALHSVAGLQLKPPASKLCSPGLRGREWKAGATLSFPVDWGVKE